MTSRSVSEARATLPELLDRVEEGEEVTITRHGKAVAVLIRPDRLRARRGDDVYRMAAELHEELEAARERPLLSSGGLTIDEADELVAEMRRGRDSS